MIFKPEQCWAKEHRENSQPCFKPRVLKGRASYSYNQTSIKSNISEIFFYNFLCSFFEARHFFNIWETDFWTFFVFFLIFSFYKKIQKTFLTKMFCPPSLSFLTTSHHLYLLELVILLHPTILDLLFPCVKVTAGDPCGWRECRAATHPPWLGSPGTHRNIAVL